MINSIDLAKFIASILVVFIHVFAIRNYEPTDLIRFLLNMVVPFFFTTSGYLMLYNRGNRLSSSIVKIHLRKYLKLYFIWLIIYLPLEIYTLSRMNISLMKIVSNLGWNVLVTGRFYKAWSLWYLLAGIQAIIIIGFLVKCRMKLRGLVIVSFSLMFAGWLLTSNLFRAFNDIREFYFNYFYTTRNGIFQALGYMSGGMLVATFQKQLKQKTMIGRILLCFMCGAVAFYDWPLGNLLFSCSIVLFITSIKIRNKPIWERLRKMSLVCYLLQMGIIYIIISFLPPIKSLVLFTIIVLTATIITASFLLFLQTKRGFTWLKELW